MDNEQYKRSLKERIEAQEFACKQLRSHRRFDDVLSSDVAKAERLLADLKTMLAHFEAKAEKGERAMGTKLTGKLPPQFRDGLHRRSMKVLIPRELRVHPADRIC